MTAERKFSQFYADKNNTHLYPTEFVVRTLLGKYPLLQLDNSKYNGKKILDLGFGDGRNMPLLDHLGFDIYAVETTLKIVELAKEFLRNNQISANLTVGRNSSVNFESNYFDFVLACHSCYYVDKNETFEDNLREISRVLKKGGTFIASVPIIGNYLLNASELKAGMYAKITDDPYQLRNGSMLKYFENNQQIEECFSEYFESFSFATIDDDYFGVRVKASIVVCSKK